MSLFAKKKLVAKESIGERLRQARSALALSLQSVARQTKIDEKYLQFIEDNEWGSLPGEVYCRNFLKKYVEFLRLDWPKFNKLYEEQVAIQLSASANDESMVNISLKKSHFFVLPGMLRNIVVGVVALLILAYIGQGLLKLIQPPPVDIIFPPDNFTTNKKSVKIHGWTLLESEIKINEQVVAVDAQGYFIEDLDLVKGLNIIKIEGKKRQGKVRVIEQKIMVEAGE